MIAVLASGGLNTVQDLGRHGHLSIGVGAAGAMDRLALVAGNLMLANEPGCAGIEVTLPPLRARFEADTTIALTGADCEATLDGRRVLPWWCLPVRSGQVLELSVPRGGSRGYLTVRGGIDVPLVLGSRSTDLKSGFGGHEGRSLRKGDRLPLAAAPAPGRAAPSGYGVEPPQRCLAPGERRTGATLSVRVIPGAECEFFEARGRALFWSTEWQLQPNSNRQGYRLDGPALPTADLPELLSHGIVPGTIQVPPSGLPIVQMSDANSSGGYPKMGTVIEADLWRLGQARLGESISFIRASIEEAVSALALQRAWLHSIALGVASLRVRGLDAQAPEPPR